MITRYGQRTAGPGDVSVSFRCVACGETAAVVKAVDAGRAIDMGPPMGTQEYKTTGVVLDYFGGTAWKATDASTFRAVRDILGSDAPDPVELRRIDWALAPFYCPDCGANYCYADWHTFVLLDEGFYDCTMGTCPSGHRHMLDD